MRRNWRPTHRKCTVLFYDTNILKVTQRPCVITHKRGSEKVTIKTLSPVWTTYVRDTTANGRLNRVAQNRRDYCNMEKMRTTPPPNTGRNKPPRRQSSPSTDRRRKSCITRYLGNSLNCKQTACRKFNTTINCILKRDVTPYYISKLQAFTARCTVTRNWRTSWGWTLRPHHTGWVTL